MPDDIVKQYEDGLPGYYEDVRETMAYLESQPKGIFSEPNIRGSGKGKRALLWQYLLHFDPVAFEERQTTGDCFVPGTMVRMADGTEKEITEVCEGDLVATPFGNIREVRSVFSKDYHGDVVELSAKGCIDGVTCTPDHRFVSHKNDLEFVWEQASDLRPGDSVLVPYHAVAESKVVYDLTDYGDFREDHNDSNAGLKGEPRRVSAPKGMVRQLNSRRGANRFVELDRSLAWLVGIWLAEGSCYKKCGKPTRLRFNLSHDEMELARKICHIVELKFGFSPSIRKIPSKPSCLFVDVCNAPIASWMYAECGAGGVYSKRVPRGIMCGASGIRMACLRAWLAGDGHFSFRTTGRSSRLKLSGVSASKGLVRDMRHLSLSCGVWCTERARKSHGHSRSAAEIFFYGDRAAKIHPDAGELQTKLAKPRAKYSCVGYGVRVPVQSISRRHYDGKVYCIEVDQDHAFIANGFGVHNCVSHGSRGARDVTRATAILANNEPFDYYKRGATEPTYGARGHSGQGMSPARASRFERDTGFLSREDHGVVDLSKYKSSIGTNWGSRGVPEDVKELCSRNKVNHIRLIKSQEDLMDAMFNGYAAHSGQSAAWSSSPSSRNVHERKSPGWNHDMAIVGYDDTLEFWPFRVWYIQNSWGKWNRPVKDWPSVYPTQPPGMIVTSADDFDVCVRSNDCWVYGGIDGYPPQKLPDLGTIGMLRHD